MTPPGYPDAVAVHGRLNRQHQVMHLVLDGRPSDIARYRYRYDQEGERQLGHYWDFHELELMDGQRVLIARELRHAEHWWLCAVLPAGEHLAGHDGGQNHSAWHELPGRVAAFRTRTVVRRERSGEPRTLFGQLATSVGHLDQLATLGIEPCLNDMPYPGTVEEGQGLVDMLGRAADFLQDVAHAMSERHG
jgi:hypothetical protein